MPSKLLLYFLFSLGLITLAACGDDDDSNNDPINVQLPQEEEVDTFSTRLTPNLLVAGTRCNGGETITDETTDTTYTCDRDNWLVTVDNINTCNAEGVCTEAAVLPFIAELDRTDRVSVPEFSYFEIDPLMPIAPGQQDIVNDVFVRFDLNSDKAEVIQR